VAEQPLKDIIVVMRDTGERNARELYRMRVENVDFDAATITIPDSKTESGNMRGSRSRNEWIGGNSPSPQRSRVRAPSSPRLTPNI
jgi:integrase